MMMFNYSFLLQISRQTLQKVIKDRLGIFKFAGGIEGGIGQGGPIIPPSFRGWKFPRFPPDESLITLYHSC